MLLSLRSDPYTSKYLYKIVIVCVQAILLHDKNSYLVVLLYIIADVRLILEDN